MIVVESTFRSLRENLGDDHPHTLSCAISMSTCLHDMGQFSAAEDLQRETIARLWKTLGELTPTRSPAGTTGR
jgi:hypothetical protein